MATLEQRVLRLEQAKEGAAIMYCWEGRREEALAAYLAQHGREPEQEVCFAWMPSVEVVEDIADRC